jgi:putative inorganic carbon (HCO3(-)) transporter
MPGSKKSKNPRTAKARSHEQTSRPLRPDTLGNLIVASVIAVVVAAPLAMWRELFSQFTLPKFLVLIVGSSILMGLLSFAALRGRDLTHLRSRYCLLVSLYVAAVGISTIASISPSISFFGSISRRMGFISYLGFVICFYAVIVGIGRDRRQIFKIVSAIVVTGFIVSAYGLAQVTGLALIAEQRLSSGADKTFRIDSTMGHPNYAGNLLLFFVFTSFGLALSTKHKALQLLSIATGFLSLVAIAFTGTRGAWVGVIAGFILVGSMLFKERRSLLNVIATKHSLIAIGLAIVCVVVVGGFLLSADAAAPIRARFNAFWGEGFSGAGRTVLWRLSFAMLGKYWAIGTGLEMFRVAFLPYKTPDYPHVSGGINPEDPHSAYLSSLLSTGVLPTLIYLVLIGFALRFFYLSIKNATEKRDKLFGIGLMASLVAVLVHNIFIFYLIPTGLYFFVFLALSFCWYQIITGQPPLTSETRNPGQVNKQGKRTINPKLVAVFCSVPVIISAAYSYRLFAADQSVLYCRAAAEACSYPHVLSYGDRATRVRVGQSDYHCYFAMALERLASKCSGTDRAHVLQKAIEEMEKSLESTLMTEVRLAYLAELNLAVGNLDRAEQLLRLCEAFDPYATSTHLIRTKLFIARGDHAKANEELKLARKPWVPLETMRSLRQEVKRLSGNVSKTKNRQKKTTPLD